MNEEVRKALANFSQQGERDENLAVLEDGPPAPRGLRGRGHRGAVMIDNMNLQEESHSDIEPAASGAESCHQDVDDPNTTRIHCATPNSKTLPRRTYTWKLPMSLLLVHAGTDCSCVPPRDGCWQHRPHFHR